MATVVDQIQGVHLKIILYDTILYNWKIAHFALWNAQKMTLISQSHSLFFLERDDIYIFLTQNKLLTPEGKKILH